MDLDGDGHQDILSGSYSRREKDMAGLFQVLRGTGKGYCAPEPLNGSDGKPLILPAGPAQQDVVDKICTRPFAADLNGDGKLDIVSGNFRGTFGVFLGDGGGRFTPAATWLGEGDERLAVQMHSDPFLIDWDGDGDLDLLSGSAKGGIFLFRNEGSRTTPKFALRPVTLLPAPDVDTGITGPAGDTRVWVDDVDGDRTLDLLIGDQVSGKSTGHVWLLRQKPPAAQTKASGPAPK